MSKSKKTAGGGGSSKFSLKKIQEPAVNTGLAIAGLVGGHALSKVHKQNTPIVNGATCAVGIVGQAFAKPGWLKALLLGLGVYGGVKLANNLSTVAVETAGLSGLPDNVKNTIKNIFPTLGEVAGDDEVLNAIEEEIMGLAATNPDALKTYRAPHASRQVKVQSFNTPRPGSAVSMAGLGNITAMI